jgi:hypothetical protein
MGLGEQDAIALRQFRIAGRHPRGRRRSWCDKGVTFSVYGVYTPHAYKLYHLIRTELVLTKFIKGYARKRLHTSDIEL